MRLGPEDFVGLWQVSRRITDHLAGQTGRFDGVAQLVAVPGGLCYAEEGLLRLGQAAPLAATRRYGWQFEAAGVAVSFSDGRPFHRFQAGVTGPGTDHLCGADLYRVHYDWDGWPGWSAVWDVQGPRKDYQLESRYSPAATHPLASGGAMGQDLAERG